MALENNPSEPVSVVVCAHDEEKNLRELVPLLLMQDYPQFEVIVVNDRSNDGTYDYLLEQTQKDARVRAVTVDRLPDHTNGKKYGITLAIKSARYDIILLTDADCRPSSNQWVRSMASGFDTAARIVTGYSGYIKSAGFLNLFIRYETVFTALQYISFALLGMPYMGVGRNLAYRKALFLDNRGFDKNLAITGGDDDLFVNAHATRENARVCIGPDALIYSIPKNSWPGFFRQKVRHLSVGGKYRIKHRFWLGLFLGSLAMVWISGIGTLASKGEALWVISGISLRLMLLIITIKKATRSFGHSFELGYVPVLDFLFVIYYLSTGAVAVVSKNQQWKKN